MYASNYREMARDALRGRWKRMAWLTFLAGLLGAGTVGSSSSVSFSSSDLEAVIEGRLPPEVLAVWIGISLVVVCVSLWSFFMGSFVRVGYTGMLKNMIDGEEPRAGGLFPRGKGLFWKCLGLNFMRSLFIGLWSILLVVPGIIAMYRYAMADYILYNNPEMGVMDALRESKECMVGRKWRLFCLEISFFGWMMLSILPLWLVGMVGAIITVIGIVPGTEPDLAAMMPLLGASAVGGLLTFIASLFVNAYLNTAVVAFFKDADRAGTWRDEARAGAEYAEEAYGESGFGDPTIVSAMPHLGDNAPVDSVLSADETVARDVFMQHKCSRDLLEKAGLLEEYLLLKASPISEARWRKDYSDELMRRFDRDPSVLDDLLSLAGEYAMDDLLNRALQRIERHLRQETLADDEILNMCGRVLVLLVSDTFAAQPGFVERKKEQISDMVDRLEARLNERDAGGAWQGTLQLIRKLCGEK